MLNEELHAKNYGALFVKQKWIKKWIIPHLSWIEPEAQNRLKIQGR
jgi:hypothetical protein